jgi:hypothetical protein
MSHAPKIVLELPLTNPDLLTNFVEASIRDHVVLICVAGKNAEEVHDVIDELVVGDGSDTSRFIVTTFHETSEEAMEFAQISEPHDQSIELVKL